MLCHAPGGEARQPCPDGNLPLSLPQLGGTNLTFFSEDCFHFSERGHAEMAIALWNNMVSGQPQAIRSFLQEDKLQIWLVFHVDSGNLNSGPHA